MPSPELVAHLLEVSHLLHTEPFVQRSTAALGSATTATRPHSGGGRYELSKRSWLRPACWLFRVRRFQQQLGCFHWLVAGHHMIGCDLAVSPSWRSSGILCGPPESCTAGFALYRHGGLDVCSGKSELFQRLCQIDGLCEACSGMRGTPQLYPVAFDRIVKVSRRTGDQPFLPDFYGLSAFIAHMA